MTWAQWYDLIKATLPPVITGTVAIVALLIGQSFQRKHDKQKAREESIRDTLEAQLVSLREVIARVEEAKVLARFIRDQKQISDAMVNQFKTLGHFQEAAATAAGSQILAQVAARDEARFKLAGDLHRACVAAISSAEDIGTISVDSQTDLVDAISTWRWHITFASAPTDLPSHDYEALSLATSDEIISACRNRRRAVQKEIDRL